MSVDLRDAGALLVGGNASAETLPEPLSSLEPELKLDQPVSFCPERSVDPRALVVAAWQAAKHREVDIVSGSPVQEVTFDRGRATGVRTGSTTYSAGVVVNCAGAWACTLGPEPLPTRPVKGQILAVVGGPSLQHVVRSPEVYLVPRSDGRLLIGATLEEGGYDKRTDPATIERLRSAAIRLLPAIAKARILEAWAGLRPGTPDDLPILGETASPGYFAATGHFRDGILLAPVTSQAMAELICNEECRRDISAFSPQRFASSSPL